MQVLSPMEVIKQTVKNQYLKTKGTAAGVESIMNKLDKTYAQVETGLDYALHETFKAFLDHPNLVQIEQKRSSYGVNFRLSISKKISRNTHVPYKKCKIKYFIMREN